jgi:hypothetical protein
VGHIAEEILAAEREHALGVQLLPAEERDGLSERINARYGGEVRRTWAFARGCASVQDADGWRWIREFIGARSCILLFDLGEEAEMFHVPSGGALEALLGNTFGFEFYATDANASYLICFNHHDFLVCCGDAEAWLRGRLQSPDDWG